MPTYLIAEVNLKNPEAYSEYLSEVPNIISKYNGEYLVRGGKISHHEGEWKPKRIVVVKFPNRKKALAFYDSKEYKSVFELGHDKMSAYVSSMQVAGID